MDSIALLISVPICSFRKPYAREFFETERIPPPATVYGFLLSLVGEEDRHAYVGTRLALAVMGEPSVSTILRTTWRIKSKLPPGIGNNKKPDYQEVLTGLQIYVCVGDCELTHRIRDSVKSPEGISRYGGLSLGESRDLVDDLTYDPDIDDKIGEWLVPDDKGRHPLPIWVDHVGSKGTVWGQFKVSEGNLGVPQSDDPKWIVINELNN